MKFEIRNGYLWMVYRTVKGEWVRCYDGIADDQPYLDAARLIDAGQYDDGIHHGDA